MTFDLSEIVSTITGADAAAMQAARDRHAGLAKPAGSLGALEELGIRLAGMHGTATPVPASRPHLIVAAGDHGVHADGVSPWPQAITSIMAGVIADGRAASTVMARGLGIKHTVLDVGCVMDPKPHERLVAARVVTGTRNLRTEDALTEAETLAAIAVGHDQATTVIANGADLLVLGDMGIANTTASACLVASCVGASAVDCTGRGTGVDDAVLAHKTMVVEQALDRVGVGRRPLELLAAFGGAEHAALVGVILAGASRRVPVVLDGVITDAAALIAVAVAPDAVDHLIAGHRSVERAATLALEHLGLRPLVELDLRLGEGSGALLAVPLVQAAARVLSEMASLADLGFDQ